jgi:hypothetical protein
MNFLMSSKYPSRHRHSSRLSRNPSVIRPPRPAAALLSANKGFDHFFANDIAAARTAFGAADTPFHLLGLGVCAFLAAALGMEEGLMGEATRLLTLSEAGAKKYAKAAPTTGKSGGRFPPGLEWEILNADAVVLLGLTHALSESYMGYFQCMYALNSAHSKFTKLYKTVFPAGLDAYRTPVPSRKASTASLTAAASAGSLAPPPPKSVFARWGMSSSASLAMPAPVPVAYTPDGPVEEMIVAGTAFGACLFMPLAIQLTAPQASASSTSSSPSSRRRSSESSFFSHFVSLSLSLHFILLFFTLIPHFLRTRLRHHHS